MMKEGEYNPYANGNMQHIYNNSRQTPDSGLGNESMNNASGASGDNGPSAVPPPGFTPNPYYVGNAQQSQYNDQQQQPYRYKQYSGGQQEGGRFERANGPPSIVTMQTSPPNMDQDGTPSYNPNYGTYQQYGNQGGPSYGGMDRNFNAPQPMTARSHSNFSESSSGTLNMNSGGPPDASVLSGQPLMSAGPPQGMMYPQQGGPMAHPYPHPHMQQGGGPPPYMQFNPAAHAAAMASQQHAQMMGGGPMGQQQGGPPLMQHPHAIPMPQSQGSLPPGPPQSVSPPHPGMMMMQTGPHGGPIHPGAVYYHNHPGLMGQRGPMAGQGPDGFVQLVYPHTAPVPALQGGFPPMRGPILHHQRSLNSPAPSDNTDAQSVHGGQPPIGVWNGPPDQQGPSPPGGMQQMQPMQQPGQQMQPMQQGMMNMQQHPSMMTASFPGVGGAPLGGPSSGGARMAPTPLTPFQVQQIAMQHAYIQQQQSGMQQMSQIQPFNAGGFPQQQQPQTGYWPGPSQGGRGGGGGFRNHRGGRGGGGGGGYGNRDRPNSRGGQYYSRNNSMTSGGGRGRGGETDENSKCTTPTEDDLVDVTGLSTQMESSLRMGDQSMEGGLASISHKQLLELADGKSVSPPAEPHPSEDDGVIIPQEGGGEGEEGGMEGRGVGGGGGGPSVPTTPRSEPRKELLEMKKTPKHQMDKSGSQTIPVDPVPPHGAITAPVGGGEARKWSEVAGKMQCMNCKGKGRPEHEYNTHNLRDGTGKVTCPELRERGCEYCHEKGDHAHDIFFCKERRGAQSADNYYPAVGHAVHSTHGEREGPYRGGQKRGGGGGGGGQWKGKGGGGHGGDRKYDPRRAQ